MMMVPHHVSYYFNIKKVTFQDVSSLDKLILVGGGHKKCRNFLSFFGIEIPSSR